MTLTAEGAGTAFGAVAVERWRALGCLTVVAVVGAPSDAAVRAVRAELEVVDRTCSRFRPDSDLARLNAVAGQPVEVSAELFAALEVALWAARRTGGLVDPTLGAQLAAAGYDRDFAELDTLGTTAAAGSGGAAGAGGGSAAAGAVPASVTASVPVPASVTVSRPGRWHQVELDGRTLRAPAGVLLDLGATAKAAAADRCAAAALAALPAGAGVLVSLGGDIAVAGRPPAGGWPVRLADRAEDDPGTETPGVTITLAEGGLATSGTESRRWRHGGSLMHHLLDPATGVPVGPVWRTVTVAAPTCVEANTASTAAVVAGGNAETLLRGWRLPARLVHADGRVRTLGGFPAES